MKNKYNLHWVAITIMLIIFFTGDLIAQPNKTVEKEKIIKEFYRIWDTGDVSSFEKVLSKNLIDHEREEKEGISDFDHMAQTTMNVHAGFSEVRHIPLQTYYLEGNKVIVYWEHTAIHTGEVAGIPPTNKQIRMKGVDIFQITNGKITEIWHVEAIHQMMAQISTKG